MSEHLVDRLGRAIIAALGAGALTAVVALFQGTSMTASAYAAFVSMLAVSAFVEWRVMWRADSAGSAFGRSTEGRVTSPHVGR
ncbi:MAG: hypothetical protein IT357_06785 [Gemmatimonadaceae bacterium]|nr:hypothetical protein [Gemmatimonadaceae bacterium]